ncbi:GAF domain-containing protein (plasmid) [Deinococcus taeanensis]|uniref:GAF domain-containing protein n=1 Tax=Deinococcus taeanensis TaxID=2737050 RepID=UPI001CDCD1DF|nr:GAF domain-containing protein [Deinococcus taeanensis]UBV45333.1 GAF domain-containing protein [Deinococcus taeanensis]
MSPEFRAPAPSPSTSLLDALFEQARAAHAVYDPALRFVRVNGAFAQLTGLEPELHVGRTLWDVLPTIPPALVEAYRSVLRTGQPLHNFQYAVEAADAPGGRFHRQASAFGVCDERGAITALVVTIEDVTAQVLSEQARQASEARTLRLQDLTSALSRALTVQEVHEVVLEEASRAAGAYAATLIVPVDDATLFVAGATGYDDEVIRPWQRFPTTGRFPVVDAIRERRAVYATAAELSGSYPDMARLLQPRTRAVAAAPLISGGRVLAALTLSFEDEQATGPGHQAFLQAVVAQGAQALERARLYDEQRRAHERAALLAQVSGTLSTSLNVRVTLDRITALTIEHVADWCVVYQPGPDFDHLPPARQRLLPVAVAHRDAQKIATLQALLRRYPSDPDSPISNEHVYRSGQPVFVPALSPATIDAFPSEERRSMIRSLGLHSLITVPLVANGRTLGCLGWPRPARNAPSPRMTCTSRRKSLTERRSRWIRRSFTKRQP